MPAKPFKVVDKLARPLTAEEVARKFNVPTTVFRAALEALEPQTKRSASTKRPRAPRTADARHTASSNKTRRRVS